MHFQAIDSRSFAKFTHFGLINREWELTQGVAELRGGRVGMRIHPPQSV